MPAQTPEQLIALVNALIIDNTTQQINPYKVRQVMYALIGSLVQTNPSAVNAVFPLLYDAFTNTFSLDPGSIGMPLQPLEIRVLKKADGNTGGFLKEAGDYVHGEPVAGTFWLLARYDGGGDTDLNNYTVFSETGTT